MAVFQGRLLRDSRGKRWGRGWRSVFASFALGLFTRFAWRQIASPSLAKHRRRRHLMISGQTQGWRGGWRSGFPQGGRRASDVSALQLVEARERPSVSRTNGGKALRQANRKPTGRRNRTSGHTPFAPCSPAPPLPCSLLPRASALCPPPAPVIPSASALPAPYSLEYDQPSGLSRS